MIGLIGPVGSQPLTRLRLAYFKLLTTVVEFELGKRSSTMLRRL